MKNPVICESCDKPFHPRCTIFSTVKAYGKTISACKACAEKISGGTSLELLDVQSNLQKSALGNSSPPPITLTVTTNVPPTTPTETLSSTSRISTTPAVHGSTDDLTTQGERQQLTAADRRLDLILKKLEKLDNIETRLNQLSELLVQVNDHETRLAILEEKQSQNEQSRKEMTASTLKSASETSAEIASLKAENQSLRNDLTKSAAEGRKMSSQLISVASCTRLAEVTISGLSHNASTDLVKLVCCIATALKFPLKPTDIINVRRSGKRKEALHSHVNTTALGSYPQAPQTINLSDLTVKLKSIDQVDAFIQAKRTLRRLHTSQLDTALLAAADAPTTQHDSLININEKLPAPIFNLLMATKHKAKPLGYRYVWYSDGCVKVKQSDDSQVVRIFSEEDLHKLRLISHAVPTDAVAAASPALNENFRLTQSFRT